MNFLFEKLETPLQYIKGVGPGISDLLKRINVETIHDFLYLFPRTYDDRRNLPKIVRLEFGETQSIIGAIEFVSEEKIGPRKSFLKGHISDETGIIEAVWFNRSFLKKILKPGFKIFVKGKVEQSKFTQNKQILVSESELIRNTEELKNVQRIIPVYPLISGLQQYKMREIAKTVLTNYLQYVFDHFDNEFLKRHRLFPLRKTIENLHFPNDPDFFQKAKERIIFDEFFFLQLPYIMRHYKIRQKAKAPVLQTSGQFIAGLIKSLPYEFTNAQKRVLQDIQKDVQTGYCMNRLIQGDVGAGKTDIAVISLLMAVETGKKGAFLVPTEVLAQQHYYKLQNSLNPIGVEVVLLKGKMKAQEKRASLAALKQDNPTIVIGTHALIEDPVAVSNLGMVVVDEQHKFGVVQRMKIQNKGHNPHCLFMTATPIPRSLMLTCYGDLDKSIIDELPPGRKLPKTFFAKENKIEKTYEFAKEQIENGRQIFIVFPLVEESEKLDLQAAIESWQYLKTAVFPEYNVGLIHGRLPSDEKKMMMDKFKNNEYQILVSTTVIEVGIDVPNANTIIIMHAERFGLSQLHQLRGRIGRSSAECFCFLIADPKTANAKQRIKAMLDTSDGFKLAEYDLRIRGPGDMLGTRQAGISSLAIGDLIRDEKILLKARAAAQELVQKDPDLKHPGHTPIKEILHSKKGLLYSEVLN